jgi:hypothetical protein
MPCGAACKLAAVLQQPVGITGGNAPRVSVANASQLRATGRNVECPGSGARQWERLPGKRRGGSATLLDARHDRTKGHRRAAGELSEELGGMTWLIRDIPG